MHSPFADRRFTLDSNLPIGQHACVPVLSHVPCGRGALARSKNGMYSAAFQFVGIQCFMTKALAVCCTATSTDAEATHDCFKAVQNDRSVDIPHTRAAAADEP